MAQDFEALVRSYSRVVAGAVRKVCALRYRTLIPDVEQEVYTALWKRLRGGKEIEHPVSYIYKTALTTALAVVRKNMLETVSIAEREESLPTEPDGAFGNLLPAERSRLLAEILERLPPEQARAVRAHLAGFNHSEVATLYGWSESVARHRIYRGIDSLKEQMRETKNGQAAGRG